MSEHMNLEQAQTIATGYGAHMVNEVRAARTIVAVGDTLDWLTHQTDAAYDRYEKTGQWEHGIEAQALDTAQMKFREALGEQE